MSDALLERLVNSPRLGLYVDRMREMLASERSHREHFYETMNESVKQEFINGEVAVASPVTLRHERASRSLLKLLDVYVLARDLGYVGHEKMLISLTRNDYEPDVCFFKKDHADKFKPNQMKFPAPDFIAEVLSESTEAIDRGIKFDDYAAHGVREYWIVDPDAELIEQYILDGDTYGLHLKMNSGTLASQIIGGFAIPVRAVFDEKANLAALRELLR